MPNNPRRKHCPRTPAKKRTERDRLEARIKKAERRMGAMKNVDYERNKWTELSYLLEVLEA